MFAMPSITWSVNLTKNIESKTMSKGLSEAQEKWLRRENALGRIVWHGPRGYGRSVYERVMKALEAKGFVKPAPFGEYEVTPAGRAALASPVKGE